MIKSFHETKMLGTTRIETLFAIEMKLLGPMNGDGWTLNNELLQTPCHCSFTIIYQ